MNILLLNGSPKEAAGVTRQDATGLQKKFMLLAESYATHRHCFVKEFLA